MTSQKTNLLQNTVSEHIIFIQLICDVTGAPLEPKKILHKWFSHMIITYYFVSFKRFRHISIYSKFIVCKVLLFKLTSIVSTKIECAFHRYRDHI